MVKNPDTTSRWKRAKKAYSEKSFRVKCDLSFTSADSNAKEDLIWFARLMLGPFFLLGGTISLCDNFVLGQSTPEIDLIAAGLLGCAGVALIKLPKTAGFATGAIAGARELVRKPQAK